MSAITNELEDNATEGLASNEELALVHERAMKRFNRIQVAMRDERMQCLQDRRFYSIAGAMWEGPLQAQYENKPKLEINKVHLSVIRIINEYRANRISVSFTPKDGVENPQLIDVCDGLYRADEQDSVADEARDNGFEEGVGGGFGAWRLRGDYEDAASDETKMRIKIEPIYDADSSVFFDLDAKRQDKTDGNYCFVIVAKDRADYIEEYGDDPGSWPKTIWTGMFDWFTPSVVYLAEYYEKEETKVNWVWYKGLTQDVPDQKIKKDDLDAEKIAELKSTGFKKYKEKAVKTTRVHKFILSAMEVKEDLGYIAGPNIPIIPYFGKRWYIDNIERCMGHVRLAKDVQRLKNMQISKLAELAASSGREKPIFTPQQMIGHKEMWSDDNVKDFPYLLINAITGGDGSIVAVGPQAYTKSPTVPQAMAELLQITDADIKDILGNQEQGEQINPAVSGIAVELIQAKLDMQTYIYISNMEKSLACEGKIWLGMAKELYYEAGRKMKTINKENKPGSVVLNSPIVNETTDTPQANGNDLTEANFDCTAQAGPASASRRAYIVKAMLGILQFVQDPQIVSIIVSIALMYMEGEGLENMREYFRKRLVQMGVVPATPEEQNEMKQAAENQAPSAQDAYLAASAQEATASAQNKQQDTAKKAAETDRTKAETARTQAETVDLLHGIHHDKISSVNDTIKTVADAHAKLSPPPLVP